MRDQTWVNREIFIFVRRIAYFPGIAASIAVAFYRIRGGILCSFLVYLQLITIDFRLHLITPPPDTPIRNQNPVSGMEVILREYTLSP